MATIKEKLGAGYTLVRKEMQNMKPFRNFVLGGLAILVLIVVEKMIMVSLEIKVEKIPMGNIQFTASGMIIAYIVSCLIYYGYIYTKPHVDYDAVDKFYYGWMYGVMLWGIMGLGGVFYNDLVTNIMHTASWVNAATSIMLCVTWGLAAAFLYPRLEKM